MRDYTMTISKKQQNPVCHITANGDILKQVNNFLYLGSLITTEAKDEKEINRRITMAKSKFVEMSTILKNININIKTRLRVLKCYIWSIVKYACETWTINKPLENKINSFEMWCFRLVLRIPWTSHTSNQQVLTQINQQPELLNSIKKQQLSFLGHVMRKEGLEHLITTRTIEGTRAKGRQRLKQLDIIGTWMGNISVIEVIRQCRNRASWRAMVANAIRHGTQ
jgi:hypothetical protein